MRSDATAADVGQSKGAARSARAHRASRGRGALALVLAFVVLGIVAAPASALPTPETTSVSDVSYGSVHVTGKVNSEDFWYFQYSTDGVVWTQYGFGFPLPTGSTVEENITGLKGGTKYLVRLAVTNFSEETPSPAPYLEFTTFPVDPPTVVSVDNASNVSYVSAKATGKIKRPSNADPAFNAECRFEYVTDAQFKATGFEGAGSTECVGGAVTVPDEEKVVEANIEGLAPATQYHLRLNATNAGGTDTKEAAATFTTLPVQAPEVTAVFAPTEVLNSSARVSGEFTQDPNPDPAFRVNCRFEYVTDEQFKSTGFESAANEECFREPGDPVVYRKLGCCWGSNNLAFNTTYHWRLTVSNAGGSDSEEGPTFTTLPAPAPPTVSIDPPSDIKGRSVHLSGVVNAGGVDPSQTTYWRFECTPECPGLGTPTSGTIEADAANRIVQADVRLKANASYQVKLIATNNAGGENTAGPLSFATPIVIGATTGSANATTTTAGLAGEVDPGGAATEYHFEWGLSDAYGQSTPTKSLVASDIRRAVSFELTGLTPGTTYHYRIVATNSAGTAAGADRTITTPALVSGDGCPNAFVREQQKSSYLTKCRAYEIVNNPSDELGDVNRLASISEDGNNAGSITTTPGKEAFQDALVSTAANKRTPTGWTHFGADAQPAMAGGKETLVTAPLQFSEDFGKLIVFSALPLSPEDDEPGQSLYRTEVGTGKATWLSRDKGTPGGSLVAAIGATPDLSRFAFAQNGNRTIWITTNGFDKELVSILPSGAVAPEAFQAGQNAFRGYPATSTISGVKVAHGGVHGISDDGRYVYFLAGQGLYRRDTFAKTTVAVNASQRTANFGEVTGAEMIYASHDGNIVYFVSNSPLLDSAPGGGGIYRWTAPGNELTLLTPAVKPSGDFGLGQALVSDDESRLYFKTPRALLPGAEEGKANVYVTQGGSTSLLASASNINLQRVSRDGRYLLMLSTNSLEGAPTNSRTAVYEYDDQTQSIACVSCRPDGQKSRADANLDAVNFAFPQCCQTPRNITDDGRVFFGTRDQLLPADETGALDVYEWDRGVLALITSGKDEADSYIVENTDDGRDVFIITRQKLIAEDEDSRELDLYDVRSGGGFLPAPAKSAPCQGEACRGAASQAPAAVAPVTPNFIGADNSQTGRNKGKRKHKKTKKHAGKKRGAGKKKDAGKKKGKSKKRSANGQGRAQR